MPSLLEIYLDTKKTDSDRDGIREYGGRMRFGEVLETGEKPRGPEE